MEHESTEPQPASPAVRLVKSLPKPSKQSSKKRKWIMKSISRIFKPAQFFENDENSLAAKSEIAQDPSVAEQGYSMDVQFQPETATISANSSVLTAPPRNQNGD